MQEVLEDYHLCCTLGVTFSQLGELDAHQVELLKEIRRSRQAYFLKKIEQLRGNTAEQLSAQSIFLLLLERLSM